MNSPYPSSKGARGLDTIRNGDNDAAYPLLEAAFNEGDTHYQVLIGFAALARHYGEFEKCLAAADRYLLQEPGDLEMNIIKGDALAGLSQESAAVNFYMAALRVAPPPDQLPAHLAKDVVRIRQVCEDARSSFEDKFRASLEDLGLQSGDRSTRLEQAVDVMLGRKQVFLPQPGKFYFPELPPVQFFNPDDFDWAPAIRDAKDEIAAELSAALASPELFEPYMAQNPIAPTMTETGLEESKKWSAIHLYKDGDEVPENSKHFPRTLELLKAAPLANIPGRSPNILFSKLQGGAHIPPHHGQINIRLLCHLPLIVPDNCWLRVGNQKRDVKEGELLIFDDSIEHEARNESAEDRIVLIFDLWRPELTEAEQEGLQTVFKALRGHA